jgi:HSP20 family protein
MTLVKHNYKAVNDLFDEFFNHFPVVRGREIGWNVPAVNIHETKDDYQVELVAPGLKKEDFKVSLEKGILTTSYEKKTETDNKDLKTHRKEFAFTGFKRSFIVDDKINTDAIEAKYDNGILKLTLPKKEEVKSLPKEIAIA